MRYSSALMKRIAACLLVLLIFACSSHHETATEYVGPSELMCTHYHNVIDFGQVTIPSLHGTIRVQLPGRDNQPVSEVLIYLKKQEPHREYMFTVTTGNDGTFQSAL